MQKNTKIFKLVPIVLTVLLFITVPAVAQLGETDTSTIYIQNISGNDDVDVTVTFVAEDGTQITPSQLDSESTTLIPNPFTLDNGESMIIDISEVPTSEVPTGRYSAIITAEDKVVAVAHVAGSGIGTEDYQFTGAYTGFMEGATTTYLASTAYNYYGWYSMISVMNLGEEPADVTLTINCSNTALVGTLTQSGIPPKASHTFVLKDLVPTGFTSETQCIASSVVTSEENIVVVNNQNQPYATSSNPGYTNTFEAKANGDVTVFVPNLSTNFYGWVSALNIVKIGSGDTEVTVDYDDNDTNTVFTLTDANPSKQLYMPTYHPDTGRYGATITSDPPMPLLASIGNSETISSNKSNSYLGVGTDAGTSQVAIPVAMKYYFGWVTAINCQILGITPTTLNFSYFGYTPVEHPSTPLGQGESLQVLTFNESFLPDGYIGGLVVTANETGAEFICTSGSTNTLADDPANGLIGDWTFQYNAP